MGGWAIPTYDGDGRRVSKVGSKLYWYGSGGDILAETNTSGATTAEYIFFGDKRIAMLPAGGNPIYYVEDLLGTSRVLTTSTGVVCYDADFYPYGGERSYTNTCPQNYKFEGKERDTETGNDDFGARYYSNRFGRWLSADWSSVPVPVPYANLTNPQTLNLYSMVVDDPESFADLDGHIQQQSQGGAEGQCGGGTGNTGGDTCAKQPADQLANDEKAGHSGMLGGVRDWLDVIEVSGSYGLGAESHGEAGSWEYHGGVGVTTEGTIGLGGGNAQTEVFAGGNAGLKAGSVAEGEIKAGGTLSSKEGASLSAEASGSLGGVGGSVKLDKSGVAVTPKAEIKKDVKVGIHGHLGLGVGVNVNLSQARRAYTRTVASAKAFGAAVVDKLHSFNLPNFRISPDWRPSVQ